MKLAKDIRMYPKDLRKQKPKKRSPYQRRFHEPLFPNIPKTTTKEGKRAYSKLYMRKLRKNVKRATR